ncbi:MAG: hypothetical protein K8S21_13180 [Gemmatimonadetes bacterium]|nr:hypothetical protein [Gemmatimonadota bacterium]
MSARRAVAVLLGAVAMIAARAGEVRLPTVVSEGVPRGLVTMIVPIPPDLADAPEVTFDVRTIGGVEILGRLRGPARVAGSPSRPLVLTLRVPAGADAGMIDVAEVTFRGNDGREFVVPLRLRVTVVRSLTVMGTTEMRALRAGDRLDLPYRIVNAGNATDTVRIVVRGPLAWGTRLDRDATAIVGPRAQLEFNVSVGIPQVANIGDHTLAVSIIALTGSEPIATVFTTLGITGRAGQVAGVVMRPSIAVASTSTGTATYSGVELSGPVRTGVSVRAQLTPAIARGGMTSQGLAAVGALSAPFSASIYGEHWDVSAGNTSLQIGDLSGVNVIGRGVTANVERPAYEARAIVGTPSSGSRALSGELLGGGYWRNTASGRVGGSVSYLRERGGFGAGRELRAVAADYRSPVLKTFQLGASLAHRSAIGVQGLGYAATISHERPDERAVLRVAHAPGGTAAFARAEDEFQFEASRALSSRWWVDASAQRSTDRGTVFAGMQARSWSLGQRFAWRPDVALTLRGQSSDFTVTSSGADIGDFGARDRSLIGGVEWRRGPLGLSAEGSYGDMTRRTELFSGTVDEAVAAQRGLRVTAARAFERWGSLDVNSSIEQTGAGVGVPGTIQSTGARWSEVPLGFGTRRASLTTEVALQRMGQQPATLVTRALARVALPAGLDLTVAAERNPFFRDPRGRPGWIGAVRLSAATRVFSPGQLGPEGLVFEDLDNDGRHDPLEPGVAGVVVRRGDAKAVTDRHGHYRLPVSARGRARIDQGSLRPGLVAHPVLANDQTERLDLPVLPTGSVLVEMELVADESGRLPEMSLEPATVILRDETGFEWVGRRIGPDLATFDGVPVGRYALTFNFARLREPLRAEEQDVIVRPHATTQVKAPLRARAIRVFTPPARRTGGPAE